MADIEEPPVDCPDCGAEVRDDAPPVDCLMSCDDCGARFWVRPVDPFDDPGDDIPPGMLAIAAIRPAFGGGTATVVGNLRGNTAIASAQQSRAVQRMTGQSVNVNATVRDRERQFRRHEKALRRGSRR